MAFFRCRLFCLLLASFLVGSFCEFRSAQAEALHERPNVVVILVDDMGYGDPGCFNPESKIATPHIDRLAADGMRFTDMHAPGPLCHLSRYGLLTGQYPFRANVKNWRKKPSIADGQLTLPRLLNEQGYSTVMVGKWHLGFFEKGYDKPLYGGPVDCGFDQYFGIRASTDIPPYFYIRGRDVVAPPTNHIEARNSEGWSPIQGEFWRAGGIAPGLELKDVLPKFTDEAVQVIENHQEADGPLFLYLAYPAPHTPWLPSAEFAGTSVAGMYGDFVTMTDAMVGKVVAALEEKGLAQNTLLVFTSDNGPVWFEHDVERFGHDSSGGLRGMKADAWENGHRMPFIARWPGHVEAGSVTDQTLCFTDLLATMAALLDVDLTEQKDLDSVDFSKVLMSDQPANVPVRQNLAIVSGNGTMTIRKGPWKLITALGSGGFSKPGRIKPEPGGPTGQLYHLGDDPGEEHNLFSQKPEIVRQLKAELATVRER